MSIVKSTISAVKLSNKGNHSGAGKSLIYCQDVENELVAWILQLLNLHVSLSVLILQEKAKKVIRPHNSTFNARNGWVEKFFSRPIITLKSYFSQPEVTTAT